MRNWPERCADAKNERHLTEALYIAICQPVIKSDRYKVGWDYNVELPRCEGTSPRRKSEAMLNLELMKSTSRGRIDICDRRSGKPSNQYPGQFLLSAMTAIEEVDCRAADYFRRSVIWFGPVMSVPGLNGQ